MKPPRIIHGRPKLSLIIPTFNEGDIIESALVSICEALGDLSRKTEIIIVDDGADHLLDIVEDVSRGHLFNSLRAIRNESRLGKGASIARGFSFAQGSVVGFIDADLSTSPQHIHDALFELSSGHDVFIAVRHESRWPHDKSSLTSLVAESFRFLHRWVLFRGSRGFPDTQCGFKFFKREVALDLYEDLVTRDGLVDLEVLIKAHRKGLSIKQRSVPRSNLREGKRSFRSIFVRESIAFLKIVIRYI